MNALQRLQNWYLINCDGDWEHGFGLSITTLDNPGWAVDINVAETALENLDFNKDYQNPAYDFDWYSFKTEDNILKIYCGPNNLEGALQIFFDEIIPQHSNPDFQYQVYIPLQGDKYEMWALGKGRLINEQTLELTEIPEFGLIDIKVRELGHFDDIRDTFKNLKTAFKVGARVNVKLKEVFDGIILTASGYANF